MMASGWIVRRNRLFLVTLAAVIVGIFYVRWLRPAVLNREALLVAIKPVRLTNCTMKRFGNFDDGGYVMCSNLLNQAKVAYSYGIDGRDEWGCDISRNLQLNVHQYDCFNTKQPRCEGAQFTFHPECIGPRTEVIEGRVFDTLTKQIERNGDLGKHLVAKIDVEGAEWESLAATPNEQLALIDQMSIEFHGSERTEFLSVLNKLKENFYIANVHVNNWSCSWREWPMPGWAFELLLVNRRLGIPDAAASSAVPTTNPLDAANAAGRPDCQIRWK